MRGFNVQEFKSVIDGNRQLLRNNRFLVDIPAPKILRSALNHGIVTPNGGPLSFYIKSIPLPGIGIATTDVNRYGYGPVNRIPYAVLFNDLMVHSYVDANNVVRQWMRLWIRSVVEADMPMGIRSKNAMTNQEAYEFGYKEDYAVDIRITTFDSEGRPAIQIVLCDAFPNYVGEVFQDWDDKNTVMLMPISITYRDWYEETVKTPRSTLRPSVTVEPEAWWDKEQSPEQRAAIDNALNSPDPND